MTNCHNISVSKLGVVRSVRGKLNSGKRCVLLRVIRTTSKAAVRGLLDLLGLKVTKVNTNNVPAKKKLRSQITNRKSAKKVHLVLRCSANSNWDSTLEVRVDDNIL